MTAITNVQDLRRLAERRIPRAIFEYADRGSYEESTISRNRADLAAIRLRKYAGTEPGYKPLTELLKQPQFQPLSWVKQVAILFAGTQGYLDQFQVSDIRAFEDGLYSYLSSAQSALIDDLTKKKQLDDDIKKRLHDALKEYSENFKASLSDKAKG